MAYSKKHNSDLDVENALALAVQVRQQLKDVETKLNHARKTVYLSDFASPHEDENSIDTRGTSERNLRRQEQRQRTVHANHHYDQNILLPRSRFYSPKSSGTSSPVKYGASGNTYHSPSVEEQTRSVTVGQFLGITSDAGGHHQRIGVTEDDRQPTRLSSFFDHDAATPSTSAHSIDTRLERRLNQVRLETRKLEDGVSALVNGRSTKHHAAAKRVSATEAVHAPQISSSTTAFHSGANVDKHKTSTDSTQSDVVRKPRVFSRLRQESSSSKQSDSRLPPRDHLDMDSHMPKNGDIGELQSGTSTARSATSTESKAASENLYTGRTVSSLGTQSRGSQTTTEKTKRSSSSNRIPNVLAVTSSRSETSSENERHPAAEVKAGNYNGSSPNKPVSNGSPKKTSSIQRYKTKGIPPAEAAAPRERKPDYDVEVVRRYMELKRQQRAANAQKPSQTLAIDKKRDYDSEEIKKYIEHQKSKRHQSRQQEIDLNEQRKLEKKLRLVKLLEEQRKLQPATKARQKDSETAVPAKSSRLLLSQDDYNGRVDLIRMKYASQQLNIGVDDEIEEGDLPSSSSSISSPEAGIAEAGDLDTIGLIHQSPTKRLFEDNKSKNAAANDADHYNVINTILRKHPNLRVTTVFATDNGSSVPSSRHAGSVDVRTVEETPVRTQKLTTANELVDEHVPAGNDNTSSDLSPGSIESEMSAGVSSVSSLTLSSKQWNADPKINKVQNEQKLVSGGSSSIGSGYLSNTDERIRSSTSVDLRLKAGANYLQALQYSIEQAEAAKQIGDLALVEQQVASLNALVQAQTAANSWEQTMRDVRFHTDRLTMQASVDMAAGAKERQMANQMTSDHRMLMNEVLETNRRLQQQQDREESLSYAQATKLAADVAASAATAATLAALNQQRPRKSGSTGTSSLSSSVVSSGEPSSRNRTGKSSVSKKPASSSSVFEQIQSSNLSQTRSSRSNGKGTEISEHLTEVLTDNGKEHPILSEGFVSTASNGSGESEPSSTGVVSSKSADSKKSMEVDSWLAEKERFGGKIVKRAKSLASNEGERQQRRLELWNQHMEALKWYFDVQVAVLHSRRRMLEISDSENVNERLKVVKDNFERDRLSIGSAYNTITNERQFVEEEMREIARLQAMTFSLLKKLDGRQPNKITEVPVPAILGSDSVPEKSDTVTEAEDFLARLKETFMAFEDENLQRRERRARAILELRKDYEEKTKEVEKLDDKAFRALMTPAGRLNEVITPREVTISTDGSQSTTRSSTSRSSNGKKFSQESSSQIREISEKGSTRSDVATEVASTATAGSASEVVESIPQSKSSASKSTSSVPSEIRTNTASQIKSTLTSTYSAEIESRSERAKSMEPSSSTKQSTSTADLNMDESWAMSMSDIYEYESRVRALRSDVAEKRQIAQKLNQEYKRRSKEEFENTTKSLMKQLENFNNYIQEKEKQLRELGEGKSTKRPSTPPQILSPRALEREPSSPRRYQSPSSKSSTQVSKSRSSSISENINSARSDDSAKSDASSTNATSRNGGSVTNKQPMDEKSSSDPSSSSTRRNDRTETVDEITDVFEPADSSSRKKSQSSRTSSPDRTETEVSSRSNNYTPQTSSDTTVTAAATTNKQSIVEKLVDESFEQILKESLAWAVAAMGSSNFSEPSVIGKNDLKNIQELVKRIDDDNDFASPRRSAQSPRTPPSSDRFNEAYRQPSPQLDESQETSKHSDDEMVNDEAWIDDDFGFGGGDLSNENSPRSPKSARFPQKFTTDEFSAVVHNPEDVQAVVRVAVNALSKQRRMGEPLLSTKKPIELYTVAPQTAPELDLSFNRDSDRIYREFLFDMCAEIMEENDKDLVPEESDEHFLKPSRLRLSTLTKLLKSSNNREQAIGDVVKSYLSNGTVSEEVGKRIRKITGKNLDRVEQVALSEMYEEEPDWTVYEEEEMRVKFEMADQIWKSLLTDALDEVLSTLPR